MTYKLIENDIEYTLQLMDCGSILGKTWIPVNKINYRKIGPSVEFNDGMKVWRNNKGLNHREIGPASIFPGAKDEYWLNGIQYKYVKSDDEWAKFQEDLMIKDIIE